MKNQKQTLRKIISFLNNPEEEGGFWLPNIQRPFVWGEEQICRLFDSILREYPISTLLVWKTTNHQITFAHDKTGYTYIDDAGKVTRSLSDGAELLGYFDPAAPEQLHLADLRGAYVGTLQRLGGRRGMVDLRDEDALKAEAARTATVLNREVAAVRARHVDQDAQLAQYRAHNADVVAEHKAKTAGLTAAERIALAAGEAAAQRVERKAHARAMQRTAAKMDDAEKAEFLPRPEPRGAAGPAESDNLGDYL